MLWEVGRNCQNVGAGSGGEECDREVRLALCWDVDGLNFWVDILVYRENGASRATLCSFVVVRRVVYQFVVF